MPPIRNSNDIHTTRHAENQMRDRNIGAFEIKKAVEEGEIEEDAEPGNVRYRLTFPGPDLIVSVDQSDGAITTVFYDNKTGAEGGAI